MGVHELFKLLEPASEPIKPNELNGKIMAVDISVWMHQFIHGTFLSESDHPDGEDEDKVEHDNIAAYLQKLFLRFCKLWFWGAKIVIVFDGQTPLLKKNTVAKRLKQKRQDEKKLHLVAKKLLKNRLEGFALDRVTTKTTPATARKQRPSGDYLRDEEELDDFALPGYNKRNESSATSSSIIGEINDSVDEASMSQLSTPDKKKASSALSESDIYNDPRNWDFGDAAVDIETVFKTPPSTKSSKTVDSVSPNSQINNDAYDEEEDPVFDYDIEDIDEEVFAKLPASVQQQLLKNMRRLKRRAPATKISTLQTHTPDSFSSTQLSNFIQGRNAHRKLQKIMQDAQEASQLEKHSNLLTPKLEDQLDNMELIGGRLASDENTRFILLTTPEKSADKEQGTRRLTNRSSSQLPASQQSASYSGNDIYDPQDEIVSERVTSIDDRDIQIDFDTPNPSHEARDDQQMLTNDNNGDVIVVEDANDDDFESVGLNNDDIVMEVDNDDDDEYESALNTTMDDETITVDLIARELFPASMFERANVLESDMFPASMFEKPSNIDSSELNRTEEVETVAIDIVETEEEYRITEEEIGSQDTGMQKQRVPVQQQFPLESDVNSIIDNIETIAETMSVSRSDEHVESVSPIYTNIEEIIDVEDTEEKPASFTIELDATEEKIDRKGKGHVIDVHETEDRLEREVDISVAPHQHSPVLSEETIREREVMIEQMREQLNSEQQVLRKELNRAKKSTQAISEHLVEKTKALLQALGIPYVESPYEADAQCGYLSQHGLVHGVVSEDSDMLLFGCSVLYRKLFGRDDCQVYSYKNIEERLGLTRRELIQLGMLLGCDYSDGVHGVGIVTGIQICDAFNRLVDAKSSSRKKTLTITDIIAPLQKFAEWVTSKDDMFDDTGGFKFKFRNIKRNFVLPHGFPDERIADAFLNPTVDKSQEEFAFGTFGSDEGEEDMVGLDIQTLHRFGAENMNWSKDTIDHHLNTLVGAYKKKVKQQNSTGPMDYYLSKPTNKNIRSEGIKRAVKGLTFKRKLESQSNSDSLESEEPITKKKRK